MSQYTQREAHEVVGEKLVLVKNDVLLLRVISIDLCGCPHLITDVGLELEGILTELLF